MTSIKAVDIANARQPLLPWSKNTWERWASIPRLHKVPIPRTKFLLLKAPASTLYEEKFLDRNMFTVPMYASRMTTLGTAVGMVIDCTALDLEAFAPLSKSSNSASTIRYFHDVKEWQEFDIEYVRILPSSTVNTDNFNENFIPSQDVLDEFLRVCSQQWQSNPDAYISVFDARGGYGVASYLICCYMCVYLKAPVHAALASVENVLATTTGTGILDITLIQSLQSRFHGTKEILFDASKVPKWWSAETDDETTQKQKSEKTHNLETQESIMRIPPMAESKVNATKVEPAISINHARKRTRNEETMTLALEPVAMDSPLYQRAKTVLDQLSNHQGFIMEECPLSSSSSTTSQIKSFNHKYKVSWISQGRRGLLLILVENIYFIELSTIEPVGSDNYTISLLKGSMNFPLPADGASSTLNVKKQHRTLLDVFLVQDIEDPNSNTIHHRFMIRDILAHNGGIVSNKPFQQRLKYIMDGVIQPRKRDTTFNYSQEPIRLRAYEFFDLDRLDYVISEVCPKQNHRVKGIILIPVDGLYYGNKDKKAMTWMLDGDLSKSDFIDCVMGMLSR